MEAYEHDSLEQESVVVFIVPTWEGGVAPASARAFVEFVADATKDHRVTPGAFLSRVSAAVVGVGNSEYGEDRFCSASESLHANLSFLGARMLCGAARLDVQEGADAGMDRWVRKELFPSLSGAPASVRSVLRAQARGEAPEAVGEEDLTEEDRLNESMYGEAVAAGGQVVDADADDDRLAGIDGKRHRHQRFPHCGRCRYRRCSHPPEVFRILP
jgi:sulfite reductase alpha subunit-like flavoprotein